MTAPFTVPPDLAWPLCRSMPTSYPSHCHQHPQKDGVQVAEQLRMRLGSRIRSSYRSHTTLLLLAIFSGALQPVRCAARSQSQRPHPWFTHSRTFPPDPSPRRPETALCRRYSQTAAPLRCINAHVEGLHHTFAPETAHLLSERGQERSDGTGTPARAELDGPAPRARRRWRQGTQGAGRPRPLYLVAARTTCARCRAACSWDRPSPRSVRGHVNFTTVRTPPGRRGRICQSPAAILVHNFLPAVLWPLYLVRSWKAEVLRSAVCAGDSVSGLSCFTFRMTWRRASTFHGSCIRVCGSVGLYIRGGQECCDRNDRHRDLQLECPEQNG
ncbi:hypothetical protein OH77DRAFT_786259 [Trametes cingulata]|nr:hypothetical protein OH77DRAFT_786259 [Trametes cingulata]